LTPPDPRNNLLPRHLWFVFYAAACSFVFCGSLRTLFHLALTRDYDSHVLFILPVSAYVLYGKRQQVFLHARWDLIPGISLFFAAMALALLTEWGARFNAGYSHLWIRILVLVLLWISGFVFCYGLPALRTGRFSLLLLVLLLPLPAFLVDRAVTFLQEGSAFVAVWLFRALNVPLMREGLVFHIPSLDLEIAKQCSGIRTSLVLLLTTLLISDLVLTSVWRKSLLVLAVIPIVILKNGLRIVTISLLTIYVDRGFLHGWLHQSGGVVFYILGLFGLLVILKLLKQKEMLSAPELSGRAAGNLPARE
jgi:exosortase